MWQSPKPFSSEAESACGNIHFCYSKVMQRRKGTFPINKKKKMFKTISEEISRILTTKIMIRNIKPKFM